MLVTKLSSQMKPPWCTFANFAINFGSEFDDGHLKGWKSIIYVTTVLDSFQVRKGINLKMINNYQVIGLYSMKYRSKKKTELRGETRLRAVSLFSVVRRAKRETSKWPRAWLMARDFFSGCRPRFARLAASPLRRACIALTKSEDRSLGGDTPAPLACLSRAPLSFLSPDDIHVHSPKATKMSLFCSSFRPLPWHRFFCFFLAQFYWRYPCFRKWVQGVFNWLYKKPMAAVFLQAYGPPTKILLLPLVTNMISATSV